LEGIRYDRLCRTSNSEAYLISRADEAIGRIDLHFTTSTVYGLLIVEREMPHEELTALIGRIDEDLVWSADVIRDDFVVTVYQGYEVGVFSESESSRGDVDAEDGESG